MSCCMIKWNAERLNADLYNLTLEKFAKSTDQYQGGTDAVVRLLKGSGNNNLRWLAVGPGLGNWERDILVALESSDVKFSQMVAYEPNPSVFAALKTKVEEENLWGKGNDITLVNEAIDGDTRFGHFDLITVSHVFYYLESPEARERLMVNLLDSMRGVMVVLHNSGNEQHQHQTLLTAEFSPRIDKGVSSSAVTADWTLSAENLMKEFVNASPAGVKSTSEDITYKILALPAEHRPDRLDTFFAVMSFLLACDLRQLPEEAKEELLRWVKINGNQAEDGGVYLSQCGSVLSFFRH